MRPSASRKHRRVEGLRPPTRMPHPPSRRLAGSKVRLPRQWHHRWPRRTRSCRRSLCRRHAIPSPPRAPTRRRNGRGSAGHADRRKRSRRSNRAGPRRRWSPHRHGLPEVRVRRQCLFRSSEGRIDGPGSGLWLFTRVDMDRTGVEIRILPRFDSGHTVERNPHDDRASGNRDIGSESCVLVFLGRTQSLVKDPRRTFALLVYTNTAPVLTPFASAAKGAPTTAVFPSMATQYP